MRDVGRKMLDKSTDRHAQCYRDRVTTGLLSDGQGAALHDCLTVATR
ncbi:hypothetical protein [Mesorhizobium sp. M7A.F.Ca.US.011.01.1.1]|nr:hypothetical protein [Mesorhizobium sp. M7A.F.Ca.US.011.01.1.1]